MLIIGFIHKNLPYYLLLGTQFNVIKYIHNVVHHHHYPFPKHYPKRKLYTQYTITLYALLPPTPSNLSILFLWTSLFQTTYVTGTTQYLSFSILLISLSITYQPCCIMYQNFLPLYSWNIPFYVLHILYWWTKCFQFCLLQVILLWKTGNNCSVPAFIYFDYKYRSIPAGPHDT